MSDLAKEVTDYNYLFDYLQHSDGMVGQHSSSVILDFESFISLTRMTAPAMHWFETQSQFALWLGLLAA